MSPTDEPTPLRPPAEILADVYRRAHRIRRRRAIRAAIALAAAISLLSVTALAFIGDGDGDRPAAAPSPSPSATADALSTKVAKASANNSPSSTERERPTCRTPSGETGVEPDRIILGAPIVASGIDSSAYGEARYAIKAAVRQVNLDGGICGRRLEVRMVDTGNDPERGALALRELARDSLALVAVPAWASLTHADSSLKDAGFLAVGTQGWRPAEFESELIWPVGPGAGAWARISIDHGYDEGGRKFLIVYDGRDPAALWALRSARDFVTALPGASLEEIDMNDEDGNSDACLVEGCDVTLLAAGAMRTLSWLQSGGEHGGSLFLPPTVLSADFAEACGDRCDGALAWTGFEAPLAGAGEDARRYARALHDENPSTDPMNQITEAAYAGMLVMVEALRSLDEPITREALRRVLDGRAYDVGLTDQPLRWGQDRHANLSMRAYRLTYDGNEFTGFDRATGWRRDAG